MPTSNAPQEQTPAQNQPQETPEQRKGVAKRRIVTLVALVAAVVVVNNLLCFALEPYGAASEVSWTFYRSTEPIDTIVAGSSYAQFSVNPGVLDEQLGSASYNLGTPAQSLDNSLAVIQTAYEDWGVKRAILCLEHQTLTPKPWVNSAIAFTQSKCQGETPAQIAADVRRLLFNEQYFTHHYSLTCAFPWAYDHVDLTPQNVVDNVRNRLDGDLLAAAQDYSKKTDGGYWRYQGAGYGGIDIKTPAGCAHGTVYADDVDEEFEDFNLQYAIDICRYCQEKGITLYVVAPPTTTSTLMQYGDVYPTSMATFKQLVESEGATYLDLNLARDEALDLTVADFFDYSHLSLYGAAKTSKALGSIIARIEAGEDVSGLFYSYDHGSWNDYLASRDYIDSVDFVDTPEEGGALVTMEARVGAHTPVEYQVEVRDTEAKKWVVARAWSSDRVWHAPANEKGEALIRVRARVTDPNAQGYDDPIREVEGTIRFA